MDSLLTQRINERVGINYQPSALRDRFCTCIEKINLGERNESKAKLLAAVRDIQLQDLQLNTAAETLTDFFDLLDKFFTHLIRTTSPANGKSKLINGFNHFMYDPLTIGNASTADVFADQYLSKEVAIGLRFKAIEFLEKFLQTEKPKYTSAIFDEFIRPILKLDEQV